MSKTWKSTPEYKRIIEILYDYWLSEPEEFRVRVSMDFIHANGETQSKRIVWQNPNYVCDSYYESTRSFAELLNKAEDAIIVNENNRFWNTGNIRRRES